MNKLTLGITDTLLIKSVKNYARRNQTSLNKLTENYYHFLTDQTDQKISPIIKKLIPKKSSTITDKEIKNSYRKYMRRKYI